MGQEAQNWAEDEFELADLGDERLRRRLIQLAQVLGTRPSESLPAATGEGAMLKAAYRFFDNAQVTPDGLLESHVKTSYQRMWQMERVLAVQDTTYLDWTHHPATTGLGPLVSATHQGLVAHSTLAISVERVPLGVLAMQVWARDAETYAQLKDHKKRTIEEKESYKWLESLASVELAHTYCPETEFVSVGDREADVYDLFIAPRSAGVELLVRAAMDRRVESEEKYLWAAMTASPVVGQSEIRVPPRQGQPGRTAQLAIRWRKIRLRPPRNRSAEKLASVSLWAVWAIELSPPPDVPAVEWLLLTTVPVRTPADAFERLAWYACRWSIEVWHKILKSGCRIEARQLDSAERLKRCLALYAVIAWRILYATMLARHTPDLPCTTLLDEDEWQALYCAIHSSPRLPDTVPSLHQAVRWIAQLGGFLNRKHDGEPGPTVLWRGFQHLADLTRMYRIFRPPSISQLVGKD